MANKNALAIYGGNVQELAAGDLLNGALNTIYKISFTAPHSFFFTTTIVNSFVLPTTNIALFFGQYPTQSDNVPDPFLSINTIAKTGEFDIIIEAANGQKFGGLFIFNYLIS